MLLLGACSDDDGASIDDRVWSAYLEHEDVTEDDAPVDQGEVVELSKSVCDLDGASLGGFLENSDESTIDLAVALAEVRCPDQVEQLR